MPVSLRLIQWIKGLIAEGFILAAAVVGILVLLRGRSGHIELTIALWAFVGLAGTTVANVLLKHRLWVVPFVASLVALVAPLACIERLNEPGATAAPVPVAVPLTTIIIVASAAGACLIGSLISGRLSGQ